MESLHASLSASEDREALFKFASMAVRKLGPCARWEDIPAPAQTAIRVIRAIRDATGHGVFWRGRPDWFTRDRLAALGEESLALRPTAKTFRGGHHRWIEGGPHADALTRDEVRAFVEGIVGRPLGAAFATFNYYDREGEEAYAHVDHPEYELNLLGILEHTVTDRRTSALWVYPEGQAPIELTLEPGEVVVFHGGSTVHQRTPVSRGEHVRVVTAAYVFDEVPFP